MSQRAVEAHRSKLVPELTFSEEDVALLDRIRNGLTEDPRLWRQNLESHSIGLMAGFDELVCLPLIKGVHRYDYQIRTALKALRELRGRAILADEVGMGKTIEAGLVAKELIIRNLARKILILVPASLTEQWREEMLEKFGIAFTVLDDTADWGRYDRLICSLDTAKRLRNSPDVEGATYDLVIVDEAHKLKNRATQNWKFVNGLKKKYILLLTATPVQNDLEELFNLVTLLKPGQLGVWSSFRGRFLANNDKRAPKGVDDLRDLLFKVMIRNRRSSAIKLPPRRAHLIGVDLSPREAELYRRLTDLIRSRYPRLNRRETMASRLSLMILQKEAGSSSHALASTLKRLSEGTQFSFDDREELLRLHSLASSIDRNEKSVRLLDYLERIDDKVIVFTQYVQTLRFLERLLVDKGISHTIFHGGLDPVTKELSIRSFKGESRVLLSTEAGGEGRNLQFANKMINYDIPWNPLKLEQRIGRIHRLGQTRPVSILSFWTKETIDEYILELLDKKINMFEMVIGELDLVLGNLRERRSFEEVLMDIWTLEGEEERRRALRSYGNELLNAKRRFRDTLDFQESLFADTLTVEG